MTYDLVVLGGGPAGVTAALRARELKASVCLIEKSRLGGVCTNSGCVPMRSLAKTARLLREARRCADLGIHTGNLSLDFNKVMTLARQTIETVHEKKDLHATLTQAGVHLIVHKGPARFTSPTTLALQDGSTIQAKSILIAVGGHARKPDFEGAHHTLLPTDLWSLTELPKRLLILGSGATGLQAASCFNTFGSQVTILETMENFAPALDETLSKDLQAAFERRGMTIVTGLGNDGVEPWIKAHHNPADPILAATGWPANLEGLGTQTAGLKLEKDAISADEYQRTNIPHIYIAGDADGKQLLVQSAFYEALLAVDNALSPNKRERDTSIIPAGGFTDPEYATVGLTEAAARKTYGDDLLIETARYDELDRATIDNRKEGLAKLILQKSTRTLLGVHLLGEESTEIIHTAATAMTAKTPIDELSALQFAYPTYSALLGIAARRLTKRLGLTLHFSELDTPHPEWERKH